MNFEPRLVRDTIHVARDTAIDAADLKVRFIVTGGPDCDPVNVPVEFVADVEVDSGKIKIDRL